MKRAKRWFWIAPAVVAVDQAVKAYAFLCLRQTDMFSSYLPVQTLIPGVLQMRYAENTGMAFSLLDGMPWLLGVASVAAIWLGWLILRRYRLGTLSRIAAMLMLGGAVGNMIDRFFRGYVVDMFEVLFVNFAVFNVADAALTVGAGLMAASLLFCAGEWEEKDAKHGGNTNGKPADAGTTD